MKITLSEPQKRLLIAIGRYGCLSAFQLTRLLYGESLSWVRPNLSALVEQELVTIRYLAQLTEKPGGRPLNVYRLRPKGKTFLKRMGVSPVYMPALREQYPLKHALESNDLVILAHQLVRGTPYQLEDFRVEFDLKQQPVDVRGYRLVPDAYTHISHGDSQWPIFWELDRSTEGKKAVARKLEALIHFVNGAYRQLFSVDSITVAFVADTPQRAKRLSIWTGEVLTSLRAEVLAPNFLFASFDTSEEDPTTVFLSPIWETSFNPEAVVLLQG